jgi:hypothetical protein
VRENVHGVVLAMPKLTRLGHSNVTERRDRTPLPAALVDRRTQRRLLRRQGHVYFEEEPGRRSAAKLLTKDEARRIAANIAKLPVFIRK